MKLLNAENVKKTKVMAKYLMDFFCSELDTELFLRKNMRIGGDGIKGMDAGICLFGRYSIINHQ